jgi:hypothetical protein
LRYPRACRKEGELDLLLLLLQTGGQHHIEVRKDRDSGTAKKLGKFFSAAIQDTMDPTLYVSDTDFPPLILVSRSILCRLSNTTLTIAKTSNMFHAYQSPV